ncbi:MAG: FAD-binding oxidoreductase, partial [Gammaproteobacteria bacterium]|nr:FAD-binding oxidoreductase [Gammaproteobacteria bacterium]
MAEFPETADAVIVGCGGRVGSTIAHHMIEHG